MRSSARRAAIITAGAALAASGALAVAYAGPASAPRPTVAALAALAGPASAARPASAAGTVRYYAFDINNGGADPGFIPVAGSNPKVFAQGDELVINDQLTTTHWVGKGYPIVGHDAGVCTLTRIPEPNAEQTLANCVVTAVVKGGSLTVQGVVPFTAQQPQPAVLAVTGGTGNYSGAAGTVSVSFTKNFKIFAFNLK